MADGGRGCSGATFSILPPRKVSGISINFSRGGAGGARRGVPPRCRWLKLFKTPIMQKRWPAVKRRGGRAQLVVFPEDNNLQLLAPRDRELAPQPYRKWAEAPPKPAGPPITVADVIHYVSGYGTADPRCFFQAGRSTAST